MHTSVSTRCTHRRLSQKVGTGSGGSFRATLLAAALLSCLFTLTQPIAATAQPAAQAQSWSLAAGSLDDALNKLAAQSKLQIVYSPDLVTGKKTKGISGQYTPAEALRRLLVETGLTWEAVNATTFVLRKASAPAPPPAPARNTDQARRSDASSEQQHVTDLEKLVVTGTRIRGAQPSSPLVMITQEEMRLAGHNNLGDVIRALPQNFSGGQNPGVQSGAGGGAANQNITGGSSLNLRGLGPDATLTLLNGARLPYDGYVQATDVAVIPVAAIDRMEVLLDGASAIYGSDAVGGVANVVLKRNYDGAELTARYGQATDGGYEQTQVSVVVGQAWTTGGLLVAAETTSSGNVLAEQRDYLDYISHPDQMTLYPKLAQDGVLISGHQKLGSRAELALDAFYTKRSTTNLLLQPTTTISYGSDSSIYGISPSVLFSLPRDWSMRVHGFIGEDEALTSSLTYSLATGALQAVGSGLIYHNRVEAAGAEFEGAMFALPGGDARLSFGGGWRKTEYAGRNRLTGATGSTGIGMNSSRYVYSELYLPLINESQEIPFVNRLSLNGAVRHDNYDRFGGATTPKIGFLWNIAPSLDIRASWGKSFKAPTPTQQFGSNNVSLRAATAFGIPGVPNTATVLIGGGGNPDLEPEQAEVITAGLVFRPSFLPGATLEMGWFDIDYSDRVVNPLPSSSAQWGQILGNPIYARFYVFNPTQAQQEEFIQSGSTFTNFAGAAYDPNNVVVIFSNQNHNASSQRVRGADFDFRYVVPARNGSWSFNAGGSWITDGQRELIEGLPVIDTAGVVSFPPKFKGRIGANWSRTGFSVGAIVNHLGGVRNTRIEPNPKGDSMTTLDLVFDYAADPSVFGGLGFNLSVMNAFNKQPPYIAPSQPYYVNYDSTNYSALGRTVSLAITKRF